jgi:cyclase
MSALKRLIPVVLLRNGQVVQSKGFKRWQLLGNPSTIVSRLRKL